ncbi:hypothetical protein NL108_014898 [Boleophthalmus pectinirostris]|uniref:nuclear factor 7, brain-like n=1 Tax=Boleophthalmus pectinirostris TaxID=150288 RepID=UPI00242ABF70|nr:nuclear factor 7, brain-like [Boleophthalmus pectinirostris]KAJ0068920.1 hypothetical protein NL108_014898 [Boleophthalmus pectinirostris]
MDFVPEECEDLSCPICRSIFNDPVMLSCSHSFCGVCIEQWWNLNEEEQGNTCPICRETETRRFPIRNLALRNATEVLERWTQTRRGLENERREMERREMERREMERREMERREEEVCSVHSEKLRLFCLRDFEPACLVCRDSKDHEYHPFRPVAEAAKSLRRKLEEDLKPLMKKLDLRQEFQNSGELSLIHIKQQASQTKKIIREEFKKFHEFLVKEEEKRLKVLIDEEEQKTRRMKDKMEAVSREIEALSETIRATEEQLRATDVSFLLQYKAAVERVQRCPLLEEPQLGPGTLIDQAKHLGNLAFHIWTSMKTMVHFSPVILDPNTAHPELVLFEDLTSFTLGDEQKLPPNPERIRLDVETVRGSVGFESGSHSWDVHVGDCEDWELGVVTDSAYYILDFEEVEKDTGWWSLSYKSGEYKTFTAQKGEGAPLKVRTSPHRVRLHLECDRRKLTFYDGDTNKVIHTFTQIHHQKLFPVFVSGSEEPITILPKKMTNLEKLFE